MNAVLATRAVAGTLQLATRPATADRKVIAGTVFPRVNHPTRGAMVGALLFRVLI